jgi:transposase
VQGKKEFNQRIYYNINLDSLVPDDHFLKRLDSLVSFNFVRDITRDYYSHTGKPSIDPVVLVKMLLVGYLFDIRSERKLVEEISLNLAYRWYIGYDLDEEIPDHSIFSKARVRCDFSPSMYHFQPVSFTNYVPLGKDFFQVHCTT